ncbi:hypothetical protein Tco_1181227, partial [Tanacetum coccineum]
VVQESLDRVSAQSVGSSNTDVLDSPCLLVLITGTSQSRQHDVASHLPKSLFGVGFKQEFHLHCKYLSIHSDVLARSQDIDSICALLVLVIGGWSRLPPIQYQQSRSEMSIDNVCISMTNETSFF